MKSPSEKTKSLKQQAYEEGLLEMIQKLAFYSGFLQACVEMEKEPEEVIAQALHLVETKGWNPTDALLHVFRPGLEHLPPSSLFKWIGYRNNLSPPEVLTDAA